MEMLASGFGFVDVHYRETPGIIATAVLQGASGVTLVDPGPAASLGGLRAGLEGNGIRTADVEAILLTHIHLDHAGATGTLVRENPRIRVFVHERGAKHVVDPTRLLESARRLYGDEMGALWGEVEAVPPANVTSLEGGETLTVGDRELRVLYTPGHASHHVSYYDAASRVALVGDVAGVRLPSSSIALPPTPPPDVDLEAWRTSTAGIRAWQPDTLFLTHFGPFTAPGPHLADMLDRLERLAVSTRRLLDEPAANVEGASEPPEAGAADEARQQRFVGELRRELRRHVDEATLQRYALAVPFEHCWLGLARYWRKRA
ncbi:MAG: MBL fold metallo-hydrolase [Luteitalea sp.]|nr:MBL fold metallo-hydrolase [Luteitalea sp.]